MNLKVPITLTDEFDDDIVTSKAMLDLASGDIHDVVYDDYDVKAKGVPATAPDYTFTSGTLSHAGKEVEFSVQVDRFSGRYSVTANELLDIKVRAAKLFAGIEGKDLASGGGKTGSPPRKMH